MDAFFLNNWLQTIPFKGSEVQKRKEGVNSFDREHRMIRF